MIDNSSVSLDFLLYRIADAGENPFISNLLPIRSTPTVVEVAGSFHLFISCMPAGVPDSSSIISSGSATKFFSAYRKKGRQVRVIAIGAENETVDRTDRLLRVWAAAKPGMPAEGLTVKQEIKAIGEAMTHKDREFLARYGGFGGAMKRSAALFTRVRIANDPTQNRGVRNR